MLSEEGKDSLPPRNVDNSGAVAGCSDAARPATESESNDVADVAIPRPSFIEERFTGRMLLSYSREILCLFVGIFLSLGFAALHSMPPRLSRPPSARPFFNQTSVILDFYKGHLDAMVERASDADLSFVMYYAPWDAESQAARQEFESVALYYYSRIFFAAINCWHPGSECRMQYSKIQSYPVLVLYSSRDSGIQYRGIISAPYIMRFLDSFMKPIERITSKRRLAELAAVNDAVVVGYINFRGLSVSPGYKEFYRAATRYLEKDPNRDVAFAIVTDSQTAGSEFGVVSFPSASLSVWNETLIYPAEKIFTSQNLLKWIGETVHRITLWLQPPGVKSLTLAPYLREGPVLFLFTPRNPLHQSNYNFFLLKQVALQYYSCDEILPMNNIMKHLKETGRNAAILHRERTKQCLLTVNESKIETTVPTMSVSIKQWINDSCCAKIVMNKCLLCMKTMDYAGSNARPGVCSVSDNNVQEICKSSDVFKMTESTDDDYEKQHCYNGDRHWNSRLIFHQESSSSTNKRYKSSMLTVENDGRSAKSLRKVFLKDQCAKLLLANKYNYPIFPEESSTDEQVKSTISACKINKTLTLIAIDSLQYFYFAEALGIDILKTRDKTAVIILDSDQESQYVLKRIPSGDSLIEFVNSYTNGLLQRTLRSDSSKRFARKSKRSKGCEAPKETEIRVPELTTDTFLKVVTEPTMNVVVMYHTPYCAFCSAVAYVYLTVAKYLNKIDHLAFVRVDGDNNDLPWEYSMDRYPSILFFPAKRKEDSIVYPFSLPVTVRNLLNFVLANLEDDSHVEALVNICRLGSGESPKECVIRTRRLCLDIIENLLRSYRKFCRNRDAFYKITAGNKLREILLKLEHIRDIHLILSSVDNLGKEHRKFQLIEQRFKTYYRNLVALGKPNGQISEERKYTKSAKTEQPKVYRAR